MRTYPIFGTTATFSYWTWLVRKAAWVWIPVASFAIAVELGRIAIQASFQP